MWCGTEDRDRRWRFSGTGRPGQLQHSPDPILVSRGRKTTPIVRHSSEVFSGLILDDSGVPYPLLHVTYVHLYIYIVTVILVVSKY